MSRFLTCFWRGKMRALNFSFYLASGEMKEENLGALCANLDIIMTRPDVCYVFEWKGNLTFSTVWDTGETGDIYSFINPRPICPNLVKYFFIHFLVGNAHNKTCLQQFSKPVKQVPWIWKFGFINLHYFNFQKLILWLHRKSPVCKQQI